MAYFEFPHTREYEGDLGYIIKKIGELSEAYGEFFAYNQITFADPITWSITSQYKAYTIVFDENSEYSYMSKKAVPAGIAISNTDYWQVLGSLLIDGEARVEIENILRFITNIYESGTTATAARYPGDYVIVGGKLYKITAAMNVGDTYTAGYNMSATTIETMIHEIINNMVEYVTPEMYGAVGDGVVDDADAIQNALNAGKSLVLCAQNKTYRTTKVLKIPSDIIFDINGSVIHGDLESDGVHAATEIPVIKNYHHNDGTHTVDSNIIIMNGKIVGNGDNNGNIGDQGSGIALYDTKNVIISNIETVDTCGDGIQTRTAENTIIENVIIGNFGRNGISPTSGSHIFNNVTISGTPFTGANGVGLDAETTNTVRETGSLIFNNCSFPDITIYDRSPEESEIEFAFRVTFNNVTVTRGGTRSLRILAAHDRYAQALTIKDIVINVTQGSTGTRNIVLSKVSGVVIDGPKFTHNNPTGQNTAGIYTSSTFKNITFRNIDLSLFTSNGYGIRGSFDSCLFDNVTSRVRAEAGFTKNKFIDCNISTYTGTSSDANDNIFYNTKAPDALLNNNYTSSADYRYITIEGSGSVKLSRTSDVYSFILVAQATTNKVNAVYRGTGYGVAASRGTFSKLDGDDLLTATFDSIDKEITISNATSYTLQIGIIPVIGDIKTATA